MISQSNLLQRCYDYHISGPITKDEEGLDEQCRWCSEGGRLFGCDFCHNTFCRACIVHNLGRSEVMRVDEGLFILMILTIHLKYFEFACLSQTIQLMSAQPLNLYYAQYFTIISIYMYVYTIFYPLQFIEIELIVKSALQFSKPDSLSCIYFNPELFTND